MVNTIVRHPGTYVNSDGLVIQFPGAGIRDAVVGSTSTMGDDKTLTLSLDYRDFPAFSAATTGTIYGGHPACAIPAGAFIKSATLIPTTAFVGATATLDVGLVQSDGTELDNDGLFAALAVASIDAIGETAVGAGALIGTILAATAASYFPFIRVGTATFTAGAGRLEIIYFMPTTNTPASVPV